jgi:lysozyme family protein
MVQEYYQFMADFQVAVALTLHNEGGYVDNPADSGGATNMGIEQRDLPNIPIRSLTVAQAVAYYAQNYWKLYYSQIAAQLIANKLFDLGVLFGVGTAVKILQGVLGAVQDGVFGPATLQAVNADDETLLLSEYKHAAVLHAAAIALRIPNDNAFLAGWERRIDS